MRERGPEVRLIATFAVGGWLRRIYGTIRRIRYNKSLDCRVQHRQPWSLKRPKRIETTRLMTFSSLARRLLLSKQNPEQKDAHRELASLISRLPGPCLHHAAEQSRAEILEIQQRSTGQQITN
jgi:hypothetical protein